VKTLALACKISWARAIGRLPTNGACPAHRCAAKRRLWVTAGDWKDGRAYHSGVPLSHLSGALGVLDERKSGVAGSNEKTEGV